MPEKNGAESKGLINAVIVMNLIRVVITTVKLDVVDSKSSSPSKRRGIERDCRNRRNNVNGDRCFTRNSTSTKNKRRRKRSCMRSRKRSRDQRR